MPRRRKSQPSPLDEPLFVVAILITLLIIFLPWELKLLILGGIALLALLYIAYFARKRRRLKESGIEQIDHMDGKQFENRLEILFGDLGYRVELTPYSGDWGADLIVAKNGIRTAVQAKRYSKAVGVEAVQEAVTAKAKYHCVAALVVTNSIYTRQARELAAANRVELWDRDWLIEKLLLATQRGR